MKSWATDYYCARIENWMYKQINELARDEDDICSARLCSLPIALVDATLETLKMPIKAIEALALAIINLLGALFCGVDCTFKGAINCTDKAVSYALLTPVALVFSPLKLLYQLVAIAYDPENATPYNTLAVEEILDGSSAGLTDKDDKINPAAIL